MTGGNDDEKHLSNGPQVAVVAAERPPPPNKAISQSPRHPAPPLPASLFPPLQTLGHSSLCLSSPACSGCLPSPQCQRWPGLQRRMGLGEPFLPLQFCHEFYMKMLPVCLSIFLRGTAFPITQRRNLLAFEAGRVALSCKLENSFELGPFSTQKGI